MHTLWALSHALGWRPDHLETILQGQPQPPPEPTGSDLKPITEQLAIIGNRLDRLDGRLTMVIHGIALVNDKLPSSPADETAHPLADALPQPVPVSKPDLYHFATKHGYKKLRAGRVWNRLFYTERDQHKKYPNLPPLRYIGFAGQPPNDNYHERILDLRSVYERLIASGLRHEVWFGATKADVNFMIHLVNDHVQLDEPLPFTDPK